jgi:cysteine desulfurase
MYANNEIGSILPISEIGAICKEAGVLFHTDAVQAVGHLHIHVKEQNIDMLSLAAHKFHGPKGVGVLYARRGIALQNLIEGGAQERGKRGGTENLPGICGLAAALEDACAHIDEHTEKVTAMRDRLIAGLSAIPHCALNGDPVNRLPGNVSFCFEGIEGEALLLYLDAHGISASSGSACTSGSLDPSHVLLAIGRVHDVAHGSLRLSLDHNNTDEEVDHILTVVPEVVAYLRGISPVWRDLQTGKREYIL